MADSRGRFEDKVALVTGASSGVGRLVAERLAAEGAQVAAVGRDEAALRSTIGAIGANALPITADVRDGAAVERAVAATVEAFGGLDLVAHAAGVLRLGPAPDLADEDWDLQMDTNARSAFLLVKYAVPALRARGGGAIVNVASVFAFAASPGSGAYAASKAAVVAFTKIAAIDHIAEGIRINAVAPGSMRTPMLEKVAAERSPGDPEAVLTAAGKLHPLGRLVEPGEVASLVLYLLSDEASAIVGATMTIDGGRLPLLGSAS